MSIVKKLGNESLEEILSVVSYAFQWELSEKNRRRFAHLAAHSWNYGSFDDQGKLASQVMVTHFEVDFHGQSYGMAGIGFVASLPEYRKQGRIDAIMRQVLTDCRTAGLQLSYLAPFSYPFYRRYGYELVFQQLTLKAKVADWADSRPRTGSIRRLPWSEAQMWLHQIYHQLDRSKRGGLKRAAWWEEYKFELRGSSQYAVYFNESGQGEGYLVYDLKGPLLVVEEWAYTTFEAFKELQQFIAGHQGSVASVQFNCPYAGDASGFFQASPTDQVSIKPYMMARIIDLESFLRDYPLARSGTTDFALVIIEDTYCPWNTGYYEYQVEKNRFRKVQDTEKSLVKGTIQSFTQVLLGYRKATELAFSKELQGSADAIACLDQITPDQRPLLADYF